MAIKPIHQLHGRYAGPAERAALRRLINAFKALYEEPKFSISEFRCFPGDGHATVTITATAELDDIVIERLFLRMEIDAEGRHLRGHRIQMTIGEDRFTGVLEVSEGHEPPSPRSLFGRALVAFDKIVDCVDIDAFTTVGSLLPSALQGGF
jgi:hypothetical protein